METLLDLDTQLLLFLNNCHSDYFDWFMSMLTRREIWIPLYAAMIYVVFKGKGKVAMWTFLFILLVPVLADLLNQHIFKPYFDRLRPFHVEELKDQLHVFNENPRGRRSFMSGHAMNSFGVAMFCILLFRNRVFTLFILLWALLVSYSRIYLGFHYPSDVVCGMGVGLLLGRGLYYTYKKVVYSKSLFASLREATYNTKPILWVGIIVFFCIAAAAYHNYIFIEEFTRRFSKLKI